MPEHEQPPEGGIQATWRRYRCPVCGHTDGVTMEEAGTARIRCSHCGAVLEARLESASAERVTVQIAPEEPRP
jgi:uncharacterized Zn finger protein